MKCGQSFLLNANVDPAKWISHAGVVKGTSEESKSINLYLATVRLKLNEHYRLLMEANKLITAETFKNAYLGIIEKGKPSLRFSSTTTARLKNC
ncbi:MAG: hypothetical protein C5B59_01855 [Bacteroidetes bacterium]|nr:MAG: hypothetical protein C5B59_01855 [Bacteroidota bacterium]